MTISRQLRIPSQFKDSVKESKSYSTVENKFKSIYLETITKIIDDTNQRFEDETLPPLMLIERIIKDENKETYLEKLNQMKYYHDLLNFNLLKLEFVSWIQHLGLSKEKECFENNFWHH